MKRFVCMFLFACLLLAFTGCQSSQTEQESQLESQIEWSGDEMSQAGLDDNPFTDEVPESSQTASPEEEEHTESFVPEESSVPPAPSHGESTVPPSSPVEPPSAEHPSLEQPSAEQPSKEAHPNTSLTYEEYNAMTGKQQQEHYLSFAHPDDFFDWYNAAKAKYDETHSGIEIGSDGIIDLGNLSGSNN